MTYTLLVADKSYSSWSLRGWLALHAFGIPCQVQSTRMYCADFARDLSAFAPDPLRTVPVLRTPDGEVLRDSLSIAWHLSEAFPDRELLPQAPTPRAEAMNLIAEMHSGFAALRGACPMNLRTGWQGFAVTPEIAADLDRVETLWSRALDRHGGPWLCGAYSLADVFFAPLATRLVTYDLPMSDLARTYVTRHLAHPSFVEWRAAGLAEGAEQPVYDMGLPRREFALRSG